MKKLLVDIGVLLFGMVVAFFVGSMNISDCECPSCECPSEDIMIWAEVDGYDFPVVIEKGFLDDPDHVITEKELKEIKEEVAREYRKENSL